MVLMPLYMAVVDVGSDMLNFLDRLNEVLLLDNGLGSKPATISIFLIAAV